MGLGEGAGRWWNTAHSIDWGVFKLACRDALLFDPVRARSSAYCRQLPVAVLGRCNFFYLLLYTNDYLSSRAGTLANTKNGLWGKRVWAQAQRAGKLDVVAWQ